VAEPIIALGVKHPLHTSPALRGGWRPAAKLCCCDRWKREGFFLYEMREKKLKATCAIKYLKCGFYLDVMGWLLHIKEVPDGC